MLVLLPVIEQMLESGMSHRQIEDELGLEGDRPVHNLLKRQRRKADKGIPVNANMYLSHFPGK
jgi:hypothetical protein